MENFGSIRSLAQGIVNKRLEIPALLFLELHRPLIGVMETATLFAEPFLAPLLGDPQIKNALHLFKKQENIELLIQEIQALRKKENTGFTK